MIRFSKALLAVGALMAAGATQAQAGFVPVLVSPTSGGTASTFVYNLFFTTGTAGNPESLTAGPPADFVSLVGFFSSVPAATVSVSGVPAGSTLSPSRAGNDLVFTFGGAPVTTNTTFVATLLLPAGQSFTTQLGTYNSTDTIALGKNTQTGPVLLPTAIPEPTSIVLGAFALPLLVFLRRRRAAV